MFKWVRAFRNVTLEEQIAEEIGHSVVGLHKARGDREWAEAMISYHERRLSRLRTELQQLLQEQKDKEQKDVQTVG